MRLLVWLLRAFIFFALFAFALNNQQTATLRWFFGFEWQAPMVFVVLVVFAAGCGFGVLAMVPSWWRHRRVAMRQGPLTVPRAAPAATASTSVMPSDFGPEHPPREGL